MGTHGCFEFLKESIRRTTEAGVVAEGHFVPNRLNQNQIEETLQFCIGLGVSKVSFLRLVNHGRARENSDKLLLSNEQIADIKCKLVKILNEK
jgi:MoaA/NifB/PqqE/SkfB family radical SAM enzyme